jgi:hypothetical protein
MAQPVLMNAEREQSEMDKVRKEKSKGRKKVSPKSICPSASRK